MGKFDFQLRFPIVAMFLSFSSFRCIYSVKGEQISFHKGFRNLQTTKIRTGLSQKGGNSGPVCTWLAKCEAFEGSLEMSNSIKLSWPSMWCLCKQSCWGFFPLKQSSPCLLTGDLYTHASECCITAILKEQVFVFRAVYASQCTKIVLKNCLSSQ